MAPHTMVVSPSIFRRAAAFRKTRVLGNVRRKVVAGHRSRSRVSQSAAARLLRLARIPTPVLKQRTRTKKVIRHQPKREAKSTFFDTANEKKKALLADAILEAAGMETRARRSSSVSSVESGSSESSVSSASSGASSRNNGSRTSVAKVRTRAANGVVKTRLRPRRREQQTTPEVPAKARTPAKPEQVEKVKREKVADGEFTLNTMNWSSWKPAIVPVAKGEITGDWLERRGQHPGVRNIGLFTGNRHKPQSTNSQSRLQVRTRSIQFCPEQQQDSPETTGIPNS